ncbi:hypothetical protein Csa_021718 [Cucumis sativus]|nr:hypothetical protein Csa_021718 [Cucumis sativus]
MSVGGSWSACQGLPRIPRGDHHHLHLTSRHSGTCSSEGQPAHTASGEDGTTGKDRLAKTPQARSVVGLRRGEHSIGGKGSPDGGRARGGRVI